jgi:hypothetical protein
MTRNVTQLLKSFPDIVLSLPDLQLFWVSLLRALEAQIVTDNKTVSLSAIRCTFELMTSFTSKANFPQVTWIDTWRMLERSATRLCDPYTADLKEKESSSSSSSFASPIADLDFPSNKTLKDILPLDDLTAREERVLELIQQLLKYYTAQRDLFFPNDIIQLLRVTQPIAFFPSASDDRVILRTGKKEVNTLIRTLFSLYEAIAPFKEQFAEHLFAQLLSIASIPTPLHYTKYQDIYQVNFSHSLSSFIIIFSLPFLLICFFSSLFF